MTFKRNDLLCSKDESESVRKELHPEFYKANGSFKLFGDEGVWTIALRRTSPKSSSLR